MRRDQSKCFCVNTKVRPRAPSSLLNPPTHPLSHPSLPPPLYPSGWWWASTVLGNCVRLCCRCSFCTLLPSSGFVFRTVSRISVRPCSWEGFGSDANCASEKSENYASLIYFYLNFIKTVSILDSIPSHSGNSCSSQ